MALFDFSEHRGDVLGLPLDGGIVFGINEDQTTGGGGGGEGGGGCTKLRRAGGTARLCHADRIVIEMMRCACIRPASQMYCSWSDSSINQVEMTPFRTDRPM